MCIAVYKPMGVKVPSKKIFTNCFNNNDDGAGFMFAYKGKVHIEKGFMTIDAFRKGLKSAIKKYSASRDGKDLPMVFHFRITSQGGVCPELTHPYPVCDDYDNMKLAENVCDFGIAHNGIIDFASSYVIKDHNDTMEFNKNILNNVVGGDLDWWKDKGKIDMLAYLLKGNKIVVLGGDGHAQLIGNWEENGGLFYSNSSYTEKKSVLKSISWYDDYGWDYTPSKSSKKDDKEDDDDDKITELLPFTKAQESDLQSLLYAYCDQCGGELIFEWDSYYKCVVAYCVDCGTIYYLNKEQSDMAISLGIVYDDDGYNYLG